MYLTLTRRANSMAAPVVLEHVLFIKVTRQDLTVHFTSHNDARVAHGFTGWVYDRTTVDGDNHSLAIRAPLSEAGRCFVQARGAEYFDQFSVGRTAPIPYLPSRQVDLGRGMKPRGRKLRI